MVLAVHGNYTVYAKKLKYNKLTLIPRCCWIDVKFGHVDHSTQGTCTLNTFVKTLSFYNAIRSYKMCVYENYLVLFFMETLYETFENLLAGQLLLHLKTIYFLDYYI